MPLGLFLKGCSGARGIGIWTQAPFAPRSLAKPDCFKVGGSLKSQCHEISPVNSPAYSNYTTTDLTRNSSRNMPGRTGISIHRDRETLLVAKTLFDHILRMTSDMFYGFKRYTAACVGSIQVALHAVYPIVVSEKHINGFDMREVRPAFLDE